MINRNEGAFSHFFYAKYLIAKTSHQESWFNKYSSSIKRKKI